MRAVTKARSTRRARRARQEAVWTVVMFVASVAGMTAILWLTR